MAETESRSTARPGTPEAPESEDPSGSGWVVAPTEDGCRLDVFVAGRLGASRSQVRRLLAQRGVRVDGVPRGPGDKGLPVAAGSRVDVEDFRPPETWRIRPEPTGAARELTRLASGPGWVVVDKPAGCPVHPLDESESGSVLNALAAQYPEIQGVGEQGLRSGVVHRLDVDTSGVLVVATEQATWERLRAAFREHRVEKIYHALVRGEFRADGTHRVGLMVAQHRPALVRVVDPEWAHTRGGVRMGTLHVRTVEHLREGSLVEVSLETGFLHQVRATLAHLGHPVWGDARYGPEGGPARQMLHASRLAFEEITAESLWPEDFRAALLQLGGSP